MRFALCDMTMTTFIENGDDARSNSKVKYVFGGQSSKVKLAKHNET